MILGIDEAGRGSLAGPVVAAAVILPVQDEFKQLIIPHLQDSKKLNEVKRKQAFNALINNKAKIFISQVEPEVIDKINILQATLIAMVQTIEQALLRSQEDGFEVTEILIDGNQIPLNLPANIRVEAIVKGDSKILEIMAASIVAKVVRDEYMRKLGDVYSQYNFKQHKGYGTSEHLEAIKKHGAIAGIHRMSFKGVK